MLFEKAEKNDSAFILFEFFNKFTIIMLCYTCFSCSLADIIALLWINRG